MVLQQHNSNFVTHEIPPNIYTIKDISEAVYTIGDHEGTQQLEYDDVCMETKLVLTRFGGSFGTLRFDKISFFKLY